MLSYLTPLWMIWSVLALVFFLVIFAFWTLLRYKNIDNTDKILLIDRNRRFKFLRMNLAGKTKLKIDDSAYMLVEKTGLLNKKGKALYIFSEGKPQPLMLEYNDSKWLDGKSLLAMINNELVQLMVKAKSSMDTILMIGAVGGMVAGLASVVVLLMQTGVIK